MATSVETMAKRSAATAERCTLSRTVPENPFIANLRCVGGAPRTDEDVSNRRSGPRVGSAPSPHSHRSDLPLDRQVLNY